MGVVLLCFVLSGSSGCRSPSSYAKLEQKLRSKDTQLRLIKSELAETESRLLEQDQQLAAHRNLALSAATENQFAMVSQSRVLGSTSDQSIPEEVLADWGSVTALRIQKLVSGIQWDSGKPILHVVIQPVDADGELRKVAGQLSVRARPIGGAEESELLTEQSWTITESRDLWSKGFVSSGFHAQIPILNEHAARTTQQLLITAGLRLGQGRVFEVAETLNLPRTAPSQSSE